MNTRKYKKKYTRTKTLKKRHYSILTPIPEPKIKTIPPNKRLYASKTHRGDDILKHAKIQEEKTHNSCLKDNTTWLSNLSVAKLYKNESNQLYKWKVNKSTQLIKTIPENELFFEQIFWNSSNSLDSFIQKIPTSNHKYFKMTANEKALYEFKFVFGYLTLEEQYEFLQLLKGMKKINQTVLTAAINYYRLNFSLLSRDMSKTKKQNRISFYELDKHVVNNLCKALQSYKSSKYPKLEGIYQSAGIKSFWYPSFIKYSKNMEEYILFNPQHELVYVGEIE